MASGLNSARSRRKTNSQLSVPSATAVTEQMHSLLVEKTPCAALVPYPLADILIINSVNCGVRDEDMEIYGLSKQDWLKVLALPNGIPCPDTFRRVFERINPKVFERCFQRWVQSIVETLGASNSY